MYLPRRLGTGYGKRGGMNAQKEFEMFHYHASCAINHVARLLLALAGKGLGWITRAVNYMHDKLIDPSNPEIDYEVHVQ